MAKTINLIFIGDRFYSKSQSHMSSIYTENMGERWDWNMVSNALSEGNVLNIRPANEKEMQQAYTMLGELVCRKSLT